MLQFSGVVQWQKSSMAFPRSGGNPMLMGPTRMLLQALCILGMVSQGFGQEKQENDAKPALSQEELEKQFSEKMAKSVLVGKFTIDGQEGENPKAERYEIESVT